MSQKFLKRIQTFIEIFTSASGSQSFFFFFYLDDCSIYNNQYLRRYPDYGKNSCSVVITEVEAPPLCLCLRYWHR